MSRIIVFDAEFTGSTGGMRIIEIGMAEMIDGEKTGSVFHAYVRPGTSKVDSWSKKIHGLSTKFLSDKPLFSEIAGDMLSFISGSDIYAHGTSMSDFVVLNRELRLASLPEIPASRFVDTERLLMMSVPGLARYGIDGLSAAFGLPQRTGHHSALTDAMILSDILIAAASGFSPSEEHRKKPTTPQARAQKAIMSFAIPDDVSRLVAALNGVGDRRLTSHECQAFNLRRTPWRSASERELTQKTGIPIDVARRMQSRITRVGVATGLRPDRAAEIASFIAYGSPREKVNEVPMMSYPEPGDPDHIANSAGVTILRPRPGKSAAGRGVGYGVNNYTAALIARANAGDETPLRETNDFWETLTDKEVALAAKREIPESRFVQEVSIDELSDDEEKSTIGETIRWMMRGMSEESAMKMLKTSYGADDEIIDLIRRANASGDDSQISSSVLSAAQKRGRRENARMFAERFGFSEMSDLLRLPEEERTVAIALGAEGLLPHLAVSVARRLTTETAHCHPE